MSALSENLKKRRNELGLTLQEIGDYLNVSKQTIQKYENDVITGVTTSTIEKLAKILEIEPWELVGWDCTTINDGNNKQQNLLTHFHALNDVGQTKVIDYAMDLSGNPDYQPNRDKLKLSEQSNTYQNNKSQESKAQKYKIAARDGTNEITLTPEQLKALAKDIEEAKNDDNSDLF